MRLLVTGAAGQLGCDLVAHAAACGDDVIATDRTTLDVGDRGQVHGAVGGLAPDVVVNLAAWTAVDACEGDRERANRVNAFGVRWLREACDLSGAHLVQLSTDYVFDGTLDRAYHEYDATDPRSVYGTSKLGGEREAGPQATLIRTSWVSGEQGNNIVKTVLRLAADGTTMRFVDDQRGCPTFTSDLARMVRRLAVARSRGVHHVTNQGPVSWYEFVREILVESGHDPSLVEPITTAELDPPRPAPRPANSVLDNAALRAAGIPLLRDFRAPLAELVERLTG